MTTLTTARPAGADAGLPLSDHAAALGILSGRNPMTPTELRYIDQHPARFGRELAQFLRDFFHPLELPPSLWFPVSEGEPLPTQIARICAEFPAGIRAVEEVPRASETYHLASCRRQTFLPFALEQIADSDLRAATLREALCLVAERPHLLKAERPIVALGTEGYRDNCPQPLYPCLSRCGGAIRLSWSLHSDPISPTDLILTARD